MKASETHTHLTRNAARSAAQSAGLDLDDLYICTSDNGMWGWIALDEQGADDADQDADQADDCLVVDVATDMDAILRRNRERLGLDQAAVVEAAEAEEIEADEAEAEVVASDEAPHTSQDVSASDDVGLAEPEPSEQATATQEAASETDIASTVRDTTDEVEKAAAMAVGPASEGDYILQVSGPMLPMAARMEAERLARKLGMVLVIRDAGTFSLVEVVKPRRLGEPKKNGDIPTYEQEIAIRLCATEKGATSNELFKAGAGGDVEQGKFLGKAVVKSCERFGYTMDEVPTMEMRPSKSGRLVPKAVFAYRLKAKPAEG